jgi:hypothetical protein
MVGFVPAHLWLLPVRLAHVHKERTALGELFATVLAEGAVVSPDALVDDPHVLLERALEHDLAAVLTGHLAFRLHVHVHDLYVALQLGPIVEPALAEFAVEADQLLVDHPLVFAQVAASLENLFADVALHRLLHVQPQMVSSIICKDDFLREL